VKQVLDTLGKQLGGEVKVVNFVRCQVGEGVEVVQENYAEEISKLSGVSSNDGACNIG
jgi:translation elongation factor EF-Ts